MPWVAFLVANATSSTPSWLKSAMSAEIALPTTGFHGVKVPSPLPKAPAGLNVLSDGQIRDTVAVEIAGSDGERIGATVEPAGRPEGSVPVPERDSATDVTYHDNVDVAVSVEVVDRQRPGACSPRTTSEMNPCGEKPPAPSPEEHLDPTRRFIDRQQIEQRVAIHVGQNDRPRAAGHGPHRGWRAQCTVAVPEEQRDASRNERRHQDVDVTVGVHVAGDHCRQR